MKVAIYARVSTDEQTNENQVPLLKELATSRGWEIFDIYVENESAWRAGHQKELSRLLKDASSHKFNAVLVWALDRLTRQGIGYILQLVDTFKGYGVRVVSHQESWTELENNALVELFYAITAWAAKYESDRRSERVKAGLARRQQKGLALGRQHGAKDKKPRKRTGYLLRHADRRRE